MPSPKPTPSKEVLPENDTREYTLKNFRQNLTHIVGEVMHTHTRIKVTSYGKVAGYFISAEDMDYWEELEEQEDIKALEEALKDPDQRTIPWDDIKKELNL